ncbi:Protein KRI1-like protein [Operophtera brumata]|uniref:Protein KRI1-like protein n=1 Tax=Operophtera brumata TaxID=104452 RepID=A0A0L7LC33_OPEBR|nr:Protein KRI1-like protein [Operophtera brumata]
MEEIGRLKALKLQEIQEKIARIKEVTGNQELAFKNLYKELCVCLIQMDADYDPSTARASLLAEMRRSLGAKRRNRKNKSKLAKLLAADKPKYIPAADDASRGLADEVQVPGADDKELTQWVPLKKIVRHKPDSVQKGEVNTYALKAADRTLKRKVLPSLFKNLPEEPELVVSVEENSKKKKKNRKKNKQKATGEAKQTNEQNIKNTDEIEPTVNEDEEQNSETEDISASEMDTVSKKKEKRKKHNVSKIAVESSPIKNADSSLEVAVSESLEVNNVETVVDDNVKIKNHKEVKKQKNKNKVMVVENGDSSNVDTTVNEIVEVSAQNGLSKRQKKNLRRKIKKKGIIVENVKNTTPSRNSQNTSAGAKKRKVSENEQQVPNKKTKNNELIQDVKKKTRFNKEGNNNKDKTKNTDLKKNNKDKFKNKNIKNNEQFKNKIKQVIDKNKQNNDKSSENPMSNLSDERLKAYGLNPKKYRGFLKYKKF